MPEIIDPDPGRAVVLNVPLCDNRPAIIDGDFIPMGWFSRPLDPPRRRG
jgi:hypothetical protein